MCIFDICGDGVSILVHGKDEAD